MPLRQVWLDRTGVTDITPAANAELYELTINDTKVADLEALRGFDLQVLEAANTLVEDVSMLGKLSHSLDISGTQVDDLTPLANARLSSN